MSALPFTGWSKPGKILCLRPELSAAIEVLSCAVSVAAASSWLEESGIGAVIVNGDLITQGPPPTDVARAHLPAIESENDFAKVEIADPRVKAALDRGLLIAGHLLGPEEVMP